MPVTEMLLEGLTLLAIGMGIVFAFLLLLVGALTLMARVVERLGGEPSPQPASAGSSQSIIDEVEVVAAISAAIALYRARHPELSQTTG
jgi:oxaloacetate decarboxylase (Na+ extruding) subunit gamma